MKIKVDFVTNSSSASFTIPKNNLSILQKILLFNHMDVFHATIKEKFLKKYSFVPDPHDEWIIIEKSKTFYGSTSMDNFDMDFFLREIGVNLDYVKSHDYSVIDDDFSKNKISFKKLKQKYTLDKLENNPCKKCLVGATCTKSFGKKTVCEKYIYFIKRIAREARLESKKRLYNK